MTRTIAAAALLAATMIFAPAAEACISCNYTPEVVNTPSPNMKPKRAQKTPPRKPAATATKKQRPPSVAKAPKPAKKDKPAESVADDSKKAKTETEAKTDKETGTEAETETAGGSSGSSGTSALMGIETANVPTNAAAEDETAKAVDEPKAEEGCRKYVPAIGAAVTVPCD